MPFSVKEIADRTGGEVRGDGRVLLTGIASLSGMAFHFLLALIASSTNRAEAANLVFHRVSITIYSCWLIAFIGGAVAGMMRMKGIA